MRILMTISWQRYVDSSLDSTPFSKPALIESIIATVEKRSGDGTRADEVRTNIIYMIKIMNVNVFM